MIMNALGIDLILDVYRSRTRMVAPSASKACSTSTGNPFILASIRKKRCEGSTVLNWSAVNVIQSASGALRIRPVQVARKSCTRG